MAVAEAWVAKAGPMVDPEHGLTGAADEADDPETYTTPVVAVTNDGGLTWELRSRPGRPGALWLASAAFLRLLASSTTSNEMPSRRRSNPGHHARLRDEGNADHGPH